MAMTAEQKLNEDITLAEGILSQTFETPIRLVLGDQEGLDRPYVHRLNILPGTPHLPKTVILKQAAVRNENDVYDPQALDGPAARLFNEWAGLQFLSEVCSHPLPAPEFYGGHQESGFIVMEDFGSGTRLDHALLGEDAALAEKTMIALFQTLGRMHAQTIGKATRYHELRTGLGPTRNPTEPVARIDAWNRSNIRQSLEALGCKVAPGFYEELESAREVTEGPGPFTAYIHSDPCPDNCHWVDDELRLLDFEVGQYYHALFDGTYYQIPFPSCWCANRIPAYLVPKAEKAYRRELMQGCPEAENDDLFALASTAVSIVKIFSQFSYWLVKRNLLDEDISWGISSVHQRHLLWFENLITMIDNLGQFPAIGRTTRHILDRLHILWPTLDAMPYYPAFRNQHTL